MSRAWLASLVVVLVASGAFAAGARADGDPASDYLITNRVFVSAQSSAISSSERQLLGVVQGANRAGFPIRVAVISSEYDLGSITELWRKPRLYARFLGIELSRVYKQRLLVVMPNGFGFSWPGHRLAGAYRALAKVPIAGDGAGLAGAAQTAVRRLAGAEGINIATPTPTPTAPVARATAGPDWGVIVAAALAALALAVALVFAARWRRRHHVPPTPKSAPVKPSTGDSRPRRIRPGWVVPGIASLCVVAVGTPIAVLSILRHRANASGIAANSNSIVTPPPFSWPVGKRPAPGFVLRDQHGRQVSVAAFHGRPVIVTFVDPLCRNLCPLEAHVLNAAVGELPAAQRPVILAVSVDVYADKRADLLQDERQWKLVPQWRWAVGTPAQLAAVWRNYKMAVSVVTKRLAKTTIRYITHTEGAYVVDSTGHERALFLWPFYPQDVVRVVRELA